MASAEKPKKLRRLKNELTLSLHLQLGEFWESVVDIRHRWRVTPRVAVPTEFELDQQSLYHQELLQGRPDSSNARYRGVPPTPEPSPVHDRTSSFEGPAFYSRMPNKSDGRPESLDLSDWIKEMGRLTTRFVSLELQHDLNCSELVSNLHDLPWFDFFQFCTLYDPPPDRLLDFAACGDPYPLPPEAWRLGSINPHVFALQDPLGIHAVTVSWYNQILKEIERRYLLPAGVSIDEAMESILDDPAMGPDLETRLQSIPDIGMIPVFEYTRDEHLRQAKAAIQEQLNMKPLRGAPRRDRLEAVQCAIWADDYDNTHAEISDKMGWPTPNKTDDYGNPRYPRVAEYVKAGRNILRPKNLAE